MPSKLNLKFNVKLLENLQDLKKIKSSVVVKKQYAYFLNKKKHMEY